MDDAKTRTVPNEALDNGLRMAEELFDTAALLDVLKGDVESMFEADMLDTDASVRLTRVLRLASARLHEQATVLMSCSVTCPPGTAPLREEARA